MAARAVVVFGVRAALRMHGPPRRRMWGVSLRISPAGRPLACRLATALDNRRTSRAEVQAGHGADRPNRTPIHLAEPGLAGPSRAESEPA